MRVIDILKEIKIKYSYIIYEYCYKKSDNPNKKIMAIIENTNKKIHFGAKMYEDYTTHKNDTRNKSHLSRHKHDNYTNVNYPSFYATNLFWNKKH